MKKPLLFYCLALSLCSSLIASERTSISDVSSYSEACSKAAKDLSSFKRNPDYTGILEHLSYEDGLLQYNYIKSKYPTLLKMGEKLRRNDIIGNPRIHTYPELGKISPSTVRYARIAGDLHKHFGNINNLRVLEIGAGYGGQAVVINELFGIQHIQLIDLPEPLQLQSKYLSLYEIPHTTLSTQSLDTVEEYDLLLSNYAFSECTKKVQIKYLNRVISRAKFGYMICNQTSHLYKLKSLSKRELVKRLQLLGFKVKILDEEPKTFRGNYVVIFYK